MIKGNTFCISIWALNFRQRYDVMSRLFRIHNGTAILRSINIVKSGIARIADPNPERPCINPANRNITDISNIVIIRYIFSCNKNLYCCILGYSISLLLNSHIDYLKAVLYKLKLNMI